MAHPDPLFEILGRPKQPKPKPNPSKVHDIKKKKKRFFFGGYWNNHTQS